MTPLSAMVALLTMCASLVSKLGQSFNLGSREMTEELKMEIEKSEVLLTTPDFVRKHGYPVETHTVTTEDGYLLTVHRIPGSPKASSTGVKTPVLVQHGLAGASDSWVLTGPERGLGFLLADEGYDVWLGNARGNTYSRKHLTISYRDLAFSNFTLHHWGAYDVPAVIDHILETTSQEQLFYIGHSLGAAMFFVMTSMRPEYNQKVRLMVAADPAVYVWSPTSILFSSRVGLPFTNTIYRVFVNANEGQLRLPPGGALPAAITSVEVCGDGKPLQPICILIIALIAGYNRKEINSTLLPSIVSHYSSGLTMKMIHHFTQIISTRRFQMYHETNDINAQRPEYDLSKTTVPVAITYAAKDILVPPEGVVYLSKKLPNLVSIVRNPDTRSGHADFLMGNNQKQYIYNDMMQLMKRF